MSSTEIPSTTRNGGSRRMPWAEATTNCRPTAGIRKNLRVEAGNSSSKPTRQPQPGRHHQALFDRAHPQQTGGDWTYSRWMPGQAAHWPGNLASHLDVAHGREIRHGHRAGDWRHGIGRPRTVHLPRNPALRGVAQKQTYGQIIHLAPRNLRGRLRILDHLGKRKITWLIDDKPWQTQQSGSRKVPYTPFDQRFHLVSGRGRKLAGNPDAKTKFHEGSGLREFYQLAKMKIR